VTAPRCGEKGKAELHGQVKQPSHGQEDPEVGGCWGLIVRRGKTRGEIVVPNRKVVFSAGQNNGLQQNRKAKQELVGGGFRENGRQSKGIKGGFMGVCWKLVKGLCRREKNK